MQMEEHFQDVIEGDSVKIIYNVYKYMYKISNYMFYLDYIINFLYIYFFKINFILIEYFFNLVYNLINLKGGIRMRVVQYGTGKMSVYTMRYVYEKGGEIVGAIDVNKDVIGKDIGDIMGTEKKGVTVTALENAEKMLQEVKPDIAIVTTMSLISDVEDALMLCARLGINAITTCEEAFYPMNSNPTVTRALDEMAKKTNCTITGSGYQDI